MKCLHNNVVVIQGKKASERKGIILPESAQEEANVGEVLCVGPECKDVKVGDTVLVPLLTMMRVTQTGAFDLTVGEKKALVFKEEDIAVMWPKEDDEPEGD